MKRKYCQFCGAPVSKLSMNQGVYLSNSCPEPSCPAHGDEQDNEYESLTIFNPDGDDFDN